MPTVTTRPMSREDEPAQVPGHRLLQVREPSAGPAPGTGGSGLGRHRALRGASRAPSPRSRGRAGPGPVPERGPGRT